MPEEGLAFCRLYSVLNQVVFHLSSLAGPTSQFLNGAYELLELDLAGRMALLMDQSRSVLPLQSAKAREFEELWREKCTRAPSTFHLR